MPMSRLQGYGWLLVGAALAVLVPTLTIDRRIVGFLEGVLPLPWARLGLGILIFWTAAALYFRSHWSATLGLLETQQCQLGKAVDRLQDIAADAERSAFLLADNLEELDVGDNADSIQALYLGGAQVHAAKLAQIGQRCRAVGGELARRPPATVEDAD
jgi:hypothetical protein